MNALAPMLEEYFTSYLTGQRAASPATIHTYASTWRIFLSFITDRIGKPAYLLDIADLDENHVVEFLNHLENDRHNSIATRNLRLAGIKGVLAFAAPRNPEHLSTIAKIQAIPNKRKTINGIGYLSNTELQTLLDAIDTSSWTGRRDKAMFVLAAQTGLRISELTSLTLDDLHLHSHAANVTCVGKGRKARTTPITQSTAAAINTYLTERRTRPGSTVFPGPGGNQLSPDAVNQRLAVHLERAQKTCTSLANRHVTVHTLRHTAAMRFLAAGIDSAVIALWLGHESTATTSMYLHADMQIKQNALDRTRQPETQPGKYHPSDTLLTWLESL